MSDSSDIRGSSVSSKPDKKTVSISFNGQLIIKVLAVVLIALLAFWAGIKVGEHRSSTSIKNGQSAGLGFRRGGFGGGFGSVTSISSSSITVNNTRSGASKTYAINSSTKVTDNGQTSSINSIADGDTVIVVPSSSNTSEAATIIVNPSFGGFGGNPSQGSSTGSSTSGSSTNM